VYSSGHQLTIAIQRANPTSTSPSRRPGSSGRKAHARASCCKLASCLDGDTHQALGRLAALTIKNGAMIQLSNMLKPIWIQSCFDRKAWCKVSYLTLHRIGYIMTSKPIAAFRTHNVSQERISDSVRYLTNRLGWTLRRICPFAVLDLYWGRSYRARCRLS